MTKVEALEFLKQHSYNREKIENPKTGKRNDDIQPFEAYRLIQKINDN